MIIEILADLVNDFNQYKNVALPNNELRAKLLLEEVREFQEAKSDIARQDAILDIIYVALGAVKENDWRGITRKFYEVHRSNMSKKVYGIFLKNVDGKIIKGPNYYAPNLEDPKKLTVEEQIKILEDIRVYLDDDYISILNKLRENYISYLSKMLELDIIQVKDFQIKLNELESDLGL